MACSSFRCRRIVIPTTSVITVTSQWARCCLKSPASRLFTQPFIQAQIDQRKHQSSASLAFAQRASNAENVSIFWRHHVPVLREISWHLWPYNGSIWCGFTHWGRDKMADISQTIFSDAFFWMKSFVLLVKFHWSHDDVTKWKHFPRNWPFVSRWNPRTKASDAELWCFL